MELRHLRYFVAVAEELHFGRAAQRLGISQPPLSQQIKQLEQDLGTRLFERTRHKVTLTPAGDTLLAEAYRLLEQADRLRSVARETRAGVLSRLSIGCLPSVFYDVLPPILDRLHTLHPEIGLSLRDIEMPSAISELRDGKLDVAFLRVPRVDAPLEARRIMDDHFVAALPSRHPLARRRSISLAQLADQPLVAYSRSMSPSSLDRILDAFTKAGYTPNFAYHGATIQSQIGFVACGLGIALVPGIVQHWRIPKVVYRPLEQPIMAIAVSLVWNSRRTSGAIDRFLEVARDLYPGAPAGAEGSGPPRRPAAARSGKG